MAPPPTREKFLAHRTVFDLHTKQFLQQWTSTHPGKLISFMMTGGGFSLLDIGKLPGSSGILANAFIPYSMADSAKFAEQGLGLGESNPFLSNNPIKSVGPEATELYSKALINSNPYTGLVCVTVNASLTTSRYRRGLNEAWIWVRNHPLHENEVLRFRYNIAKYTEEEYGKMTDEQVIWTRQIEDMRIACVVMSCLASDSTYRTDALGESVEEVEDVANT